VIWSVVVVELWAWGWWDIRPEMMLDNHPPREKLQIEVVEIFIVQLKRTILKRSN